MTDLFSNIEDDKKTSIGKTEVEYKTASSILTKASGFMETYDFTLNPYSGCSFTTERSQFITKSYSRI